MRLDMVAFHGDPVDPPIRLVVEDGAFDRYIERASDQDLRDLWPEDPPEEAAFKLALVHLDEVIDSHHGPLLCITVDPLGFTAHPPSRRRVYGSGLSGRRLQWSTDGEAVD